MDDILYKTMIKMMSHRRFKKQMQFIYITQYPGIV